MAYIKKKSERKFKITVCNGYKVNGQKRMKAQTITVPSSVPKRGIQQYVMAEAERIEKKFKYGVEESDQTHFDQYAENWLKRQEQFFKATTYAGYKRNLDIVYPLIGGIPLAKLRPMTLEEMCEELRKRPERGENCIKETTVQKYLETVSSVLEDSVMENPPFLDYGKGRQHFLLSPLDYPPARTVGAVNGGCSPFTCR